MNESAIRDSAAALAAQHRELSERIAHLDAVIVGVEGDRLRPVEAALLERYRHHRAALLFERDVVEHELRALNSRSDTDAMVGALSVEPEA